MVAEWAKTVGDTISPVNLLQKLNAEMYTYDPNKYQVKTTPFTKPKVGLAELVSNKPPINIPTVRDLVTKQVNSSQQVEPGKVENQVVTPKVTANPSGSGTGKKSTPMKKESWVMDLQKTINAETGANLVEDGKWGPKTEAAYKVYAGKINDSRNPAGSASLDQLPKEGLAATVAPKEVGFWERLLQDDRTPEQKAAEQQAVFDKILNATSDNTGLAAAQYGR
jgi:hypothetical protein